MTRVALAVASVGGVGYIPFAPGTFGSAAGLAIWWLLPPSTVVHAVAIVAVFAVGTWSAHVTERHYARTDPGYVVIDEVVGLLITLFMIPVGWKGALVALLLFRVADIVKPYPANRLERLHGGLGIMADDAMAGVYANLALRLSIWLSGHLVTWSLMVQLTNPMTK